MPERGPLILAVAGVGLVTLAGFVYLGPAFAFLFGSIALFGIVLGVFIGATLPPEWVEEPVEGPVTALRRRQPWTEPGFVRDRAYLRGVK